MDSTADKSKDPLANPPAASNEHVRKSMQGNKRANTKPELKVREMLRAMGYTGYRLQWTKCPGRPDIAFPGRKIALYVNGCFWHRCPKCNLGKPKKHSEYWEAKFKANQERDARNLTAAKAAGWKTITIWECELKKKALPGTERYLYHAIKLCENSNAIEIANRRIAQKRKLKQRKR